MEGMNFLKKTTALVGASFLLNTAEAQMPTTSNQENPISHTRVIEHKDQNMPSGFKREQVFGKIKNNQEAVVASLFWFEDGETKACFISNDLHPEAFAPEIDYKKIEDIARSKGSEPCISFAGAYKASNGNIEGVAIEDGKQVGEGSFSKWSGVVYVTKDGSIELYRCKDSQEKFDTSIANGLVRRAEVEKGSMFQQIPAIWNGQKKLNSSSQDMFEFRAICQTRDGKKFVLNCTEKITLNDFLGMALELKDVQGNPLVDDLMLEDTGVYSYGQFKDNNQKTYTMVDENFATNKAGYTNIVSIGVKKF